MAVFSKRQLEYKRNRIAGMSIKAAAIKAGYAYSTACVKKLDRVSGLDVDLEMAGMTGRHMASKVFERFTNDDGVTGHKYLETALKVMKAPGYTQDKSAVNNIERAIIHISLPTNDATSSIDSLPAA